MQAKSFNGSGASIDSIQIPVGPRLGNDVVEVAGLSKGYGDRLLIDNASFSIPAGAIVGKPYFSKRLDLCLLLQVSRSCISALARKNIPSRRAPSLVGTVWMLYHLPWIGVQAVIS